NQVRADAEGVHRSAACDEVRDLVLVPAAGGEDLDVAQTGFVQQLARLCREVGYVARIEPDGSHGKLPCDDNRVAYSVEGVVGVDEQRDIVRMVRGERAERLELAGE